MYSEFPQSIKEIGEKKDIGSIKRNAEKRASLIHLEFVFNILGRRSGIFSFQTGIWKKKLEREAV